MFPPQFKCAYKGACAVMPPLAARVLNLENRISKSSFVKIKIFLDFSPEWSILEFAFNFIGFEFTTLLYVGNRNTAVWCSKQNRYHCTSSPDFVSLRKFLHLHIWQDNWLRRFRLPYTSAFRIWFITWWYKSFEIFRCQFGFIKWDEADRLIGTATE